MKSTYLLLAFMLFISCDEEDPSIPFVDQLVGTYIGEMTESNCVSQMEILVVPNFTTEISKDSDTQINISMISEQNGELLDFKGIINSENSFTIPEFTNTQINQTYSGKGILTSKLEIQMTYCAAPDDQFLNLVFKED